MIGQHKIHNKFFKRLYWSKAPLKEVPKWVVGCNLTSINSTTSSNLASLTCLETRWGWPVIRLGGQAEGEGRSPAFLPFASAFKRSWDEAAAGRRGKLRGRKLLCDLLQMLLIVLEDGRENDQGILLDVSLQPVDCLNVESLQVGEEVGIHPGLLIGGGGGGGGGGHHYSRRLIFYSGSRSSRQRRRGNWRFAKDRRPRDGNWVGFSRSSSKAESVSVNINCRLFGKFVQGTELVLSKWLKILIRIRTETFSNQN